MFTIQELEIIEEFLNEYQDDWVVTAVDRRMVDVIMAKIDRELNG